MCCQKDSSHSWHFHMLGTIVSEFHPACNKNTDHSTKKYDWNQDEKENSSLHL